MDFLDSRRVKSAFLSENLRGSLYFQEILDLYTLWIFV